MKVKLENSEINMISDEELQLATGGTTVSIQNSTENFVLEYSCPKCGSVDLEGIEEGKIYASGREVYNEITNKQISCRQCGYSNMGFRFTILLNGEKIK